MRTAKLSEVQIIKLLKEVDAGREINDVCRDYGISRSSFYRLQAQYKDMTASDLSRLKDLEKENRRLKKMFAETSLQNEILKEIIEKKL